MLLMILLPLIEQSLTVTDAVPIANLVPDTQLSSGFLLVLILSAVL